MSARPDKLPVWATDATYASGPDTGQTTKLEPTSGEKASGHFRGDRPPARKMNWQFGKTGEWLTYLDSHADRFARYCLIEPKGTTPTLWSNAESIAWCQASNAFASLESASGLRFFSGANAAANDGIAVPTAASQTSHRLVANETGTILLCRSFGSSVDHRLTRWSKSAGTFTTPSGLPNGTVRPVAVWIRSGLFLVTDAGNAYTLNGSTLTVRTAPGITALVGASNGTITVIGNSAGGVRATSDDGATWGSATLSGVGTLSSITWFPRTGQFIAAGSTSGADRILLASTNGTTWSTLTTTLTTHRAGPQNLRIYGVAVAAGGNMLVARGYQVGTGDYTTTRALLYSFDALDWYIWDLRVAGDEPSAIAAGPSQVAVLYPSGVVRLFGAG